LKVLIRSNGGKNLAAKTAILFLIILFRDEQGGKIAAGQFLRRVMKPSRTSGGPPNPYAGQTGSEDGLLG
jgi:hypothetical protein